MKHSRPRVFRSDPGQPGEGGSPPLFARVRKSAVWSILNTLTLRFANIAITAIVAHLVTPHAFGEFAVALTAYLIMYALGTAGIGTCLMRADLDIDSLAPTMVTVSWAMSTLIAGLMAKFATQIAAALGSVDGSAAIRVMAIAMMLQGFTIVPYAQLAREFKQGKLFLANAIAFVPSTALLIILAKSGSGAMAFAWSKVINQLILLCVMVALVSRRYRPGATRSAFITLLKVGFPTAGASIIAYMVLNVDNVFIGHFVGAVQLGLYVLAFNVSGWPGTLVGGAVSGLSLPAFSRVKHDPERLKKALARSLRMVSLIIMPSCALMMVLARPLVLTIYGARWAPSAEVLSILSVYTAISAVCSLFIFVLAGLGRPSTNLVIRLLWLGFLIPAMALGVHLNGIVGAAVAHVAIIGGIMLPLSMLVLRRVTAVSFSRLRMAVLPSVLAASAAAFAARWAASQVTNPLFELIAGAAAGAVVYLIIVGRECVAFLSDEQAAELRMRHVVRMYSTARHAVRTSVGGRQGERRNAAATDGVTIGETGLQKASAEVKGGGLSRPSDLSK